MDSWSNSRLVQAVLVAAVLAVWGVVLYRVATQVTASDEPASAPATVTVDAPTAEAASLREPQFGGRFSDPFRIPKAQRPAPDPPDESEREPEPEPEPPRPEPPPPPSWAESYAIVGLVDGTALVRGPSGAVHVLGVGDRLDSARVARVTRHGLVLTTPTRTDSIRMTPDPSVALR